MSTLAVIIASDILLGGSTLNWTLTVAWALVAVFAFLAWLIHRVHKSPAPATHYLWVTGLGLALALRYRLIDSGARDPLFGLIAFGTAGICLVPAVSAARRSEQSGVPVTRPPNQRMKVSRRGGDLRRKKSVLSVAALTRSLSAIR